MKHFLFLALSILLFGCKSREEKVAELIKNDMFKTLYDFQSYEPIETTIDSAFSTAYMDTTIIAYALTVKKLCDELEENRNEYNEARRTIEIWSENYSSLGIQKCSVAREKTREYLEKLNSSIEQTKALYKKIRNRNDSITHSFIGWRAKHKFRCKTKGGNFDLGNYIYVFDKKIDSIIYKEDIDVDLKSIIDEAIKSKDESTKPNSNTERTRSSAAADSLAAALKGLI